MSPVAEVAQGLAPMEIAARRARLAALCSEDRSGPDGTGIDALVVTALSNVRYLTGFTGSSASVVLVGDTMTLVTDGRYAEQAPDQLSAAGVEADVRIGSSMDQLIIDIVTAAGCRTVGLEAGAVSWARQRRLVAEAAGIDLVPTDGLVEQLRLVKDAGEIARMRAAAAIVDAALAEVRPLLFDGVTEARFAAELDAGMRRRGATDRSFETIVASGPNAALPHARPTDRVVAEGDLVVIDCGAIVDGYCSDMTRTVAVGALDPTRSRVLEVVIAAHDAGVAAVAPGVAAADVDAAARAVIEEAGWGERFGHGTGHGVGLDIHEAPRVAAASDATLAAGHIITVEPGVYLPGVGGARFEDTLVVVPGGSDPLTRSPQDAAAR